MQEYHSNIGIECSEALGFGRSRIVVLPPTANPQKIIGRRSRPEFFILDRLRSRLRLCEGRGKS